MTMHPLRFRSAQPRLFRRRQKSRRLPPKRSKNLTMHPLRFRSAQPKLLRRRQKSR